MNLVVCLAASTLSLLQAGGHLWFYLNWALGLKALGCRVLWLEQADPQRSEAALLRNVRGLKDRLAPFRLDDSVVLTMPGEGQLPPAVRDTCLGVEAIDGADMLLNLGNKVDAGTICRFRRSALVDIDPGIMQIWVTEAKAPLPRHDRYFSIGETVGTPEALFPDCGVQWHYTPTAIYLPAWPVTPAPPGAPYTTVSSWWGWWETYEGETFNNEKRTEFLKYLALPQRAPVPLELALALWGHREGGDVDVLQAHGWAVREAFDVGSTPMQYRDYVGRSRGEFSCVKPSYMRLQTGWISDRSLCYMAMGKPAVVQDTGRSRVWPDGHGLFRFRDMDGAIEALSEAERDYQRYGREARALVEEHCDAETVVRRVLERTLS